MSLRDQLLQAGLISQKQARDADREAQRRSQPPPKQKRDAPQARPGQPRPGGTSTGGSPPGGSPAGSGSAGGASPAGGGPAHALPRPRAPPPHSRAPTSGQATVAHGAKAARDQVLNRQKEEKARRKALAAQIKQLVEQNRVPPIESDDWYNFVDGTKIRRIAVDAEVRRALIGGRLAIVRHGGGYDLVPTAVAERIRERDAGAVVARVAPAAAVTAPTIDPAAASTDPAAPATLPEDPYAAFVVPDDLIW